MEKYAKSYLSRIEGHANLVAAEVLTIKLLSSPFGVLAGEVLENTVKDAPSEFG